jgi:hypothetical protein
MKFDFTPTLDKGIVTGLLILVIAAILFVTVQESARTWLESLGSGLAGALFALLKGGHASQENQISNSTISQPVTSTNG